MTVILGIDPTTLRDRVDLLEVGRRLDELGEMRNLDALCERAWLLTLGGRLDDALDAANQAFRLARFTGDRQDIIRPRILRAQVLQHDGKYAEATAELNACVTETHTHDWRALEAVALHRRGLVSFDQALYAEALADFRGAVKLREILGVPADRMENMLIAVAVAESFLDEQGASESGADRAGGADAGGAGPEAAGSSDAEQRAAKPGPAWPSTP